MSLFGDLGQPFGDHFKEGEVFTLEAVRVGPEIDTDFGRSRPAMLRINGAWYSIFGQGLVGQVRDVEDGDLPARVKIVRKATKGGTSVKLIVPADDDSTDLPV